MGRQPQIIHMSQRNERKRLTVKPPRWSHQDELSSLRDKIIFMRFTDGSCGHGKLIEADQFTLLVEFADKSRMTYFKHAIKSYNEVPR